jgi:hypothetical protein
MKCPTRFPVIPHSTRRSIAPYLEKYSMTAEIIPLESFLHISHTTDGTCNIAEISTEESKDSHLDDSSSRSDNLCHNNIKRNVEVVRPVKLLTFDSLLLLKITKNAGHK